MALLKPTLSCFLFAVVALAGCTDDGGDPVPDQLADGAPELEVTDTTGGIRGVVVDEAIRPIKGATVEVTGTDKTFTTAETGLFAFSGLDAGTYFVKASHPLYDQQQQSIDVVAGVPDPTPMKFLLTRVILANPYLTTEKFDGYIVCSAGHPEVGYSEECGEGAGVPCVAAPIPCGRVGGQDNNQVQYDFYIDNLNVSTIVIEMSWEPTAQTHASGELLTYVSTEWVCNPFCEGQVFVRGGSGSPMYLRADVVNGTASNTTACNCGSADLVVGAPITAFTWANPDVFDPVTGTAPLGSVLLNQPYQLFVTKSYYLPLPEGYSLVLESPYPF